MHDLQSQFVPNSPSQFGKPITARSHKCTYCLLLLLLRPVLSKCRQILVKNYLLGNFQTGPEAHPASYSVRTGVLPGVGWGVGGRGVKLLTSI